MRPGRFLSIAGFVLVLLSSGALLAQQIPAQSGGSGSAAVQQGAGSAATGCPAQDFRGRAIAPYTAMRKTTRVQKLANGVTITSESSLKEARDSSGRTYRESQPETAGTYERSHTSSFINVYDPVRRVSISWSADSREATVYHMQPPSRARSLQGTRPGSKQFYPAREVEQLGTKTINGLDATGSRTTTIYPAGTAGNDLPFTVTNESWMSVDLGISLLEVSDDPRTGVRTIELTEIERGEPAPSLFQPPEGYTVKEQYPGQQN